MKKANQSGGGKGQKEKGVQSAKNRLDETGQSRHSFGGDVHCSGDRNAEPSF